MGINEIPQRRDHRETQRDFAKDHVKRDLDSLLYSVNAYDTAVSVSETPLTHTFFNIYRTLWEELPEERRDDPVILNRNPQISKLPWKKAHGQFQIFFPQAADFLNIETEDQGSKGFRKLMDDPKDLLNTVLDFQREENLDLSSPENKVYEMVMRDGKTKILYFRAEPAGPHIPPVPMDLIIDSLSQKTFLPVSPEASEAVYSWAVAYANYEQALLQINEQYNPQLRAVLFNSARSIGKIVKGVTPLHPYVEIQGKEYVLDPQKNSMTIDGKPANPDDFTYVARAFLEKLKAYLPQD